MGLVRDALLLAGALGLGLSLVACGSSPLARSLTFAQAQAVNPGVHASWLQQEYPFARVLERWPDGKPRRLRYAVTDPQGKAQTLDLELDPQGVVVQKRYSGRILRPPRDV